MKEKLEKYGLQFNKSKKLWDEAIPIGNGNLGCLIYGDGPLKFAIDRIDLWDDRCDPKTEAEDFNYENFIKYSMGDEADWETKKVKFDMAKPRKCYPTKLSACRLIMDVNETSDDFRLSLNIGTGVATLKTKNNDISAFVCANRSVGVIKIRGEYKLKIHIPSYVSNCTDDSEVSQQSGVSVINGLLDYPKADIVLDGEFTYFKQQTLTDFNYSVVLLERENNGCKEIYYTVSTSKDSENCVEYAKSELLESAELGYEKLLKEHVLWWTEYWNKSSIELADYDIEKTYYRSLYLLASTSRNGFYPMPLQGVWTADNDELPPWKGDYHHDTNTEMSYWGYGKANRLEQGRVFADYLWDLRKVFCDFANRFYNVQGYLIPASASIGGKFMGGWAQYSLSPTMTIWAAKSFDDYYFYSGDEEFLKTKALPFFKGVETAIKGLFIERNGKYYLPLSSSPEIYEEKSENFKIGNTNFDQSLILYLYQTLIRFCEHLGEDCEEYRNTLSKLDNIYLSKDNVVMLSQNRRLPFSHRHFSHLMCVYPLNLIKNDSERNREIIYNSMLEIEQLGTGWWVGFSFPWCATLYSKLYNGNAAYEKLRIFNLAFLSDNGFHLNGDYKHYGVSQWHYRPFTLEALFAYVDAVQEMLMQDDKGYLELFCAIPDIWKDISFTDLRTKNGVLVSAAIKDGKLCQLSFKSEKQTLVKVKVRDEFVYSVRNKKFTVKDGIAEIEIGKGNTIVL